MNNMHRLLIAGVVASYGLAGCGASGGTSSPNPPNVAPVSNNVLQFAVGTANLYGTPNAGLNVVATYRQPAGSQDPGGSGTLVNTISLSVPAALPAPAGTGKGPGGDCLSTVLTGAATSEVGGKSMTSTSQSPQAAGAPTTTFGQSGGVFGLGIEPFNYQGPASNAACGGAGSPGVPYTFVPYPVPLYAGDFAGTAANSFVPWGGPPQFDVAGNGQSIVGNPNYQKGVSGAELGIDVFAGVTPAAGGYTLNVTIPTTTAGAPSTSQTYTLNTPTSLGTATAPALTFDGTGGGTLAFTLPTGATEAVVQVVDYGPSTATPPGISCASANANGASQGTPLYYSLEATATGTLTLTDKLGPQGTWSICPGDEVVVQTVGADYPLAELAYTKSAGTPNPAYTGANGASGAGDNITISAAACGQVPAAAGATAACPDSLPLLKQKTLASILSRH
jgi:hypothetical protein